MTTDPSSLHAPLVLISGASQGIGADMARQFAALDVRLALVARNTDKLLEVQSHCRSVGCGEVEIYGCDVGDAEQVASLHREVNQRQGSVSVLINNAGQWLGEPVLSMAVEDFDRIVATNLRSVFLMSKTFVPDMQQLGQGDVFTMASTAGIEGYAGVSAYCAAKHGVMGFCKALREELREEDIRVCCVLPGPTWSPSWENTGVDRGALMPSADVARAFVQLYCADRNVVTEELVLRPRVGHFSS